MKRDKLHNFLKNISISSIALIISVLCFFFTNSNEVQAEDAKEYGTLNTSISEDYAVADYAGSIVKKYIEQEAPVVDGYLFAGWYSGRECTLTQSVRKASSIQDGMTYYAKLIPEAVLSVKAQVSDRDVNVSQEGNQRNMRFVSSVDNLNYSKIGFVLQYEENGEWVTKSNTSKTVYTRIKSASFGDEYSFSPKVVDARSEYFITATWTGTTNEGVFEGDFDSGLYVRAYWITLDGVQVFGESRYVSVSDGINESTLNMPIKKGSLGTGDSVTATYGDGDSTVSFNGTVAYTDEVYAHVRFNMGDAKRTSLNSATSFTIKNSESVTLATEVYRNYYKNANEAIGADYADDSWYTQRDDGQKEFVIATVDDLYGLAKIVNDTTTQVTFEGCTIYLVSDVVVNNMSKSEIEDAVTRGQTERLVEWSAIGYNADDSKDSKITEYFCGTFDGQGHTIKGIYAKAYGFFGWALDATVKNFSLKESCFDSAKSVGSIVCTLDGTIESVYSDAIIVAKGGIVGGLVARTTNAGKTGTTAQSSFTMTNCWYAGDIIQEYSAGNIYSGGLVGFIVQGTTANSHVINHSLYTGSIVISNTASGKKINAGGLVGAPNGTSIPLVLSDCLVAGNYSVTEDTKATMSVGSVVGTNGSVTSITKDTYVYATSKWNNNTVLGASDATKANVVVPESNYDNYRSYNTMQNLDYYKSSNTDGYWVVRDNGVPVLKSFAEDWIDVAWYYDNNSAGGDTFTITTKEQLYGFAALSKDNTFSKETIQLGKDIKLNQGTIDKELYTDEEWNIFVAGLRKWKSIGSSSKLFAGKFDGKGYEISGLYQHATSNYSGLFASTDDGSEVRDLKLTNSYFSSTAGYMGSIAGQGAGTFDTIYSDACVEGAGTQIGGIIGRVNRVGTSRHVINNCWFDGNVTLTYDSDAAVYGGAIAGAFVQGTLDVTNCLNTGSVTHISTRDLTKNTNYYVGGICGAVMNPANLGISNCLNAGVIKSILENGTKDAHKIVSAAVGFVRYGTDEKNPADQVTARTTLNRFFNITGYCKDLIKTRDVSFVVHNGTKDFATEENLTGKNSYINAVDKKNNKLGFYTNNNTTGAWVVTENGLPALKSFTEEWIDVAWYYDTEDYAGGNNTFELSTPEEFYGFSAVSQEYSFENDVVKLCNNVVLDKVPGREWTPIGRASNVFRGTFDGCGNTVSGICVNSTEQYIGLFGHTFDSTIKNLRIRNSYFAYTGSKDAYMGSLIGYGDGIVQNVYSDAIVCNNPTEFNKGQVGGLVGRVQRYTSNDNQNVNTFLSMTDCWFDGEIHSGENGTHAGGIAGVVVYGTLDLNNILFTGKITSQYIGTKEMYMGGLVGRTLANPTNLLIDSAISAGTIEGDHTYSKVGAIVGNVGNGIMNNNKSNASPNNPKLELINVFATRECFGIPYFTDGVKNGTLLVSAAQKDEEGNVIAEAVTETITSTIEITNQVIWVQNADRLIGYCTEDVAPEVGYVGGSLGFTSESPAWIMRGEGTPVPAVFEDLLNPIYGTQKVSVGGLDKAIGLDIWSEFDTNASVQKALHYGNGKYVLTLGSKENDSKSFYKTYIAHLTKSVDEGGLGFTTFASNTLDEVYDTIYTKEDGNWVLNVLYTANTGVTTITIRTGIDEVLSPNLKAENVVQEGEENITLSMLTLTGSEEKEEFIPGVETHLYNYGNSFVFQLPNKHFIISDGGNKNDLAGLITYLHKLIGTEEKIVIDAWIASHQHGDHFGVMMEFVNDPSLAAKISVEAIYINEPNNRALDFIYYDEDDQKYEKINEGVQSQHRGMRLLKTSSNEMTPIYSYQTGERYYFNGMTMDVIQTQEQIPVTNYAAKKDGKAEGTDFNTVSSVVLFTTKDGEKNLIGGDANYKNMEYIMNAYGTNPETLDGIDVFVAFHHGKNTSYNISSVDNKFTNYLTDNGVNKFDVVLFPCEKLYGANDTLFDRTDYGSFPAAGAANNHLIDYHISSTGRYYTYGADTSTVILVEFGDTITHREVSIPK